MGVTGLWEIIQSEGNDLHPDELASQILSVDISILLHQGIRGIRGANNEQLEGAHLMILFRRICKLLFHGIKPVMVFDGAHPPLKQRIISERLKRGDRSKIAVQNMRDSILKKVLYEKAIEETREERSANKRSRKQTINDTESLLNVLKRTDESKSDPFNLPVLDKPLKYIQMESTNHFTDEYLNSIEINSSDFQSLPGNIREEILIR